MDEKSYIRQTFIKQDELLKNVLKRIETEGMPQISVEPESGKFLTLLAALSGAKKALEIGALGGYSGIHIMRGLKPEGTMTSLELNENYANIAKHHLEQAGYSDRVTYMIGPAQKSLERLKESGETFDFFFIDADKRSYIEYAKSALEMSKPGALIIADNTRRNGKVYDETVQDNTTEALRHYNEFVANHPRLDSLLIPIGDGLTLSRICS